MEPLPRPASYHHGDLRRALLDAVVAHVAERGNAGEVTLREVARLAGVSHNAPYRHFPDKQAILAEVAAEGFGLLSASVRNARESAATPEDRFVSSGVAYLQFAQTHPGHLAVMFGPEIAKSQTRELQMRANETFTILTELAIEAGATPGVEARRIGTVVWSLVHGLAVLAQHKQIPGSVSETPTGLAELGMRQLFVSMQRPAEKRRRPNSRSNK
jgi:AcrR family transcriptional regulator